jgi:hypothetical protein
MTAELELAIADACLGERAGDVIEHDLRGFLAARGVAVEDVDAILAAPRRLAVYRSLVRNGLEGVVVRMLARTRTRLNAACGGRFDADVARFLDEVGPRTHYLRDVPHEFFAWAGPQWSVDPRVPAYLSDLATHELACFAVAAAPTRPDAQALGEVAPDRALVFADSTRLMRYASAVHELPADETATDLPSRRDVHLLAYRDPGHAVRWLELTPLAGAIVGRLMRGDALQSAIRSACDDHGTAPAAVATSVARLLADLGERGVLLGAKSD